MPPKRRRKTAHPSPPAEHPRSPSNINNNNEKHPTPEKASQEPPTASPMTPEEMPLSEPEDQPFPATDEEMPEETIHTIPGTGDHQRQNQPGKEQGQGQKHTFSGGYNALKSYKGQYYSGMAVGGSHTWNYDQGEWKETKEEPDLWRIEYRTNKRRARKAPQGSGAPVGTEYHWFIVGHQHVKKVDANTYETVLTGSKYKLAYKSATSNSWSVPTVKKQREREVELLEDAKLRVQGLPPVSEKVKVEKQEKGQTKLDAMFSRASVGGTKRKAADDVPE